jgi:hypothetical protein
MQMWKKAADYDESALECEKLRARLGEISRAARDLAALARTTKKPALQLAAWREAARLFARVRESDNARWSWTEVERVWKSLGPKAREKLSDEAVTAAAEAHFALGGNGFEDFKRQQIKPPLMTTLNRKIALLQAVKKRAEDTVALRQAEPAVCAMARLGEAQMILGQSIAQSPFPPALNAAQRKLYRDALGEKAQPLYLEARETLRGADEKARELGVTGACPGKVTALLDKLGAKPAARPQLFQAAAPLALVPDFVDAEGGPVEEAQ